MSLSLHSSTEYLGGSNRWSRNERDMVPVKSSMGLISSKISSRPDCSGTSFTPASRAASTRPRQRSLPSSQSNESVCRARRPGTSSGSLKRAKVTRRGAVLAAEALRDAANRGPSELVADYSPHAHETPCGHAARVRGCRGRKSAAQIGSVAQSYTARQLYLTLRFTVAPQHGSFVAKRQVHATWSRHIGDVTNTTFGYACDYLYQRVSLAVLFRTPSSITQGPATAPREHCAAASRASAERALSAGS